MTQNSISMRSQVQTSKNRPKTTETPPGFRCETVFGPPPAKADIATSILTNVIEHLVLLFPPNKRAFTAKAAWADFYHCRAITVAVIVAVIVSVCFCMFACVCLFVCLFVCFLPNSKRVCMD